MSLFQSNLRKQIRNLPKILNFVKKIHYFSKLFTSLLRPHHDELRARLQAQVRRWNPGALAALVGECAPAEFPELFDRKVCGCLGCRFPAHLVHKAIRRKTELEQMQAQVIKEANELLLFIFENE